MITTFLPQFRNPLKISRGIWQNQSEILHVIYTELFQDFTENSNSPFAWSRVDSISKVYNRPRMIWFISVNHIFTTVWLQSVIITYMPQNVFTTLLRLYTPDYISGKARCWSLCVKRLAENAISGGRLYHSNAVINLLNSYANTHYGIYHRT